MPEELNFDLMLTVNVETDSSEDRISEIARLVCVEVARQEELAWSYVSISVVDDEVIRELNHTYRSIDAVTDVLSFALLEGDEPTEEEDTEAPQVLGDIVISWQQTCSQAHAFGHGVEREFAFLLTHGLLHLLGYDHDEKEDELYMFERQEQILQALGFTR